MTCSFCRKEKDKKLLVFGFDSDRYGKVICCHRGGCRVEFSKFVKSVILGPKTEFSCIQMIHCKSDDGIYTKKMCDSIDRANKSAETRMEKYGQWHSPEALLRESHRLAVGFKMTNYRYSRLWWR